LSEKKHEEKILYHLNQNLLCSIDLLTTGPRPYYHDLLQICILPLNNFLKPLKSIVPFFIDIRPKRIENASYHKEDLIDMPTPGSRVSQEKFFEMVTRGVDSLAAADRFEEWFNKLQMRHNKRICILAHDYIFKMPFLIDWLGIQSYNAFFDPYYRDLVPAALFCNDKSNFKAENIPYPKVHLAYLASTTKTEIISHDLLGKCVAQAEIYTKMMWKFLG